MRVVFVLHSLANYAGIERVMSDKMNYMARQGHKVTLVTYEQGQHPYTYALNDAIQCINFDDCCFFSLYRYRLPLRLWRMWRMKHLFRCHFHKLVANICPDVIITVSNAGDFMNEIMTAPCGRKIVEIHGAYPAVMGANAWHEKIKSHLLLKALKKSDMLISLTQADADCWKSYVSRVLHAPNPVAFYDETLPNAERQNGRILYVGRLEPEKRVDRLIDAFALIAPKYPDWHVDIYGTGCLKEVLLGRARRLQVIDSVHFFPPTHQIKREIETSQMLVLSSDFEAFGLVVVEAMACGTPVVSTRCPFGPSEIIVDGVSGLLCKMDVLDLAAKMEWMIVHEIERKKIGLNAYKAAARFKKENVMKEWENAYMSVLDK